MQGRIVDEIGAFPQDLSASASMVKTSKVKNDVVIGSGGFVLKEDDHYYVWAVLTHECVEKHKVSLHKIGKKFMEEIAPKIGIKQVTAFVIADFTAGIEWAEVFGFERAGIVPPGEFIVHRPHVKMRRIWD
jgi:hypothetical protein